MGIKEIKETIKVLNQSPNQAIETVEKGKPAIDWKELKGFIGDRKAMRKLLLNATEKERTVLINRAKRYDTRARGWGYRFAKGNRGLIGKGKHPRIDYRPLCFIGWKEIANALNVSEGMLRYNCNVAKLRLPKWSEIKCGKGSSSVYIPRGYLSLFLLRLFYGNQKMPAHKRFTLMLNSIQVAETLGFRLFLVDDLLPMKDN